MKRIAVLLVIGVGVPAVLWGEKSITAVGDVEANRFIGDGSLVTNVNASQVDGFEGTALNNRLTNVETLLIAVQNQLLARRIVLYAKVDADATGATLLSGDAVATGRITAGVFAVTFPAPVTGCGWAATRQDNLEGVAASGEVTIELGTVMNPETLWVRTFNSAGTAADPSDSDGFTVVVIC